MKLVGYIFEKEEPSGSAGCGGLFYVLLFVIFCGLCWAGFNKAWDWMKGPDKVREERIAAIEKEKNDLVEFSKNGPDPFSGSEKHKKELRDQYANLENEQKQLKLQALEASQQKSSALNSPDDKSAIKSTSGPILTLALLGQISLPANVVSTAEIVLMDSSGKEINIPSGSNISIQDRSAKGILKIRIKGDQYVGHEDRILGKVLISQ